ncbi:MAG: carbohydrate ABC transporter permease [Eubacteriales bacterium]|nr:carbohydrate ABC transporter permease [Eubacteriales bacterium]
MIRRKDPKTKLQLSYDPKLRAKRVTSQFLGGLFRYLLLFVLGFLILKPILHMISQTFMNPEELGSPTATWIPTQWSKEHLYVAYEILGYPKRFLYTFVTVLIQAFCQMVPAVLAGYALARLPFRGRNLIFGLVILTIVVPPQVIALPQYMNFRNFDPLRIFSLTMGQPVNLIGSEASIYLLSLTGQGLKGGLFVYIYRQFFRTLPKELEESAFLDGAGFNKTFFRIILPNAGPASLTVFVLSFVWNWNDMYFVKLFTNNDLNLMVRYNRAVSSMQEAIQATLRGSALLSNGHFLVPAENPFYQQTIANTLSFLLILPLIIFYLIIQRRFVQGAAHSGVKG